METHKELFDKIEEVEKYFSTGSIKYGQKALKVLNNEIKYSANDNAFNNMKGVRHKNENSNHHHGHSHDHEHGHGHGHSH